MVSNGPPSDGNSKLHVKTILQNIEVLATGREPVNDGKRSDRPVATLLVNAEDAEALSIADHAGFVRLALRNPLDGEVHITSGGRLSDLTKRSSARSSRRKTRVPAGPRPSTTQSKGRSRRRRPAQEVIHGLWPTLPPKLTPIPAGPIKRAAR